MSEADVWSLATADVDGMPVACVETSAGLYRLEPSLARVGLNGASTVVGLFAEWDRSRSALSNALGQLDEKDRVEAGRRLSPLTPGKVVCTGANYYDHLAEMGMPDAKKEDQRLFFFLVPPATAVVGEGKSVHLPIDSNAFDWEVELAVVIGKRARAVSVETAMDYVAGYTVAIDFTARDLNRAPETFYKLDWTAGKAQDTCTPLGPRFVPADAIADPQDIALSLKVNGQIKQDARTSGMIFSVAEQLAAASRIMTFHPGDVLLTGTPAGVGVPRQDFLSVGDSVEAEIENIGRLAVEIQPPAY